jgi:hypothetical protein
LPEILTRGKERVLAHGHRRSIPFKGLRLTSDVAAGQKIGNPSGWSGTGPLASLLVGHRATLDYAPSLRLAIGPVPLQCTLFL